MEFEGKEYSEETIDRLKKVYLTALNFTDYPILEEFGLSMKPMARLLGVILPKETPVTIEEVRTLYSEYPTPLSFSRMVRKPCPATTFILEEVVGLDWLKDRYVEKNYTIEEMLLELDLPGLLSKKSVNQFLTRHGIKHKPEDAGVNSTKHINYWLSDPEHSRRVQEKRERTTVEVWGHPSSLMNPIVKEKSRKTMLERFGVENPMKSKEIMEKSRRTYMERTGFSSPAKNPEVIKKMQDTSRKRYNFPSFSHYHAVFTPTEFVKTKELSIAITKDSNVLREFLKKTFPSKDTFTLNEIADITGRNYSFISSRFSTHLDFITSSVQGHLPEKVQLFLEELGYTAGVDFIVNDRDAIKPQEIDFYFPKQKVGIEVNDLLTHNSTYNPYAHGEPKPKSYHMEKSLKAKEQGIRLIHAWEHYFNNPQQYEVLKNAIKHALGISKNRVYARNTYVKEVPNITLKGFFNTNNIQGFRGAKTAYALFDKKTDEVLMAYSVGASHFAHNKYDMELIRGASKLDTTIVGGASKLWKFIIDSNPEVNSIVYYIDRNIYNGSSIGTLDGHLELVSTQVGFWNYFVDTSEMKNRQPAKHKEIKELVSQGKVWEVYNAGTETYVWTRE